MKNFNSLLYLCVNMRPAKLYQYRTISWCISQRFMYYAQRQESNQRPQISATPLAMIKGVPSYKKSFCHHYSQEHVSDNSEITEAEYEDVSEETLDSLTEKFEDLGEESFTSKNFDVNYASGVITIKLGDNLGTYVINKQTPNKQIWLSSPISGPKRYDFLNSTWIYKHDHTTLHQILTEELSEMYKRDIDFTECSFGQS